MESMKSFLLEIGTEEIPARFISDGANLLKDSIVRVFEDSGIGFGNISLYATPRRLAIVVDEVSEKQKDKKIEIPGPPKKISYDSEGRPTAAAIGFAKTHGIDVKKLKIINTDRGEYVASVIEQAGKKTKDVLAEVLPKILTSLHFPKTMRWGNGSMRFVRPIHWIAAIFGENIIPFKIDGLKSGNKTRGHRFMSKGEIKISKPSDYSRRLADSRVIADPCERKKRILDGLRKIESVLRRTLKDESSGSFRVHADEELLDTVVYLTEYPTVILGNFDSKYLSLPKELLITVMKNQQKYFSTEDRNGSLLPHFIVVSNTDSKNSRIVKKGAERVIRARLEDAGFYFNEDKKIPLQDYVEKLKKVTFQEKLGSVYDKAERIASICSFMADILNTQDREKIQRTAMLSKADLVTGIVREFPELQGYIGMIYAKESGEDNEVAAAIYEHYMPKFSGDTLPSNDTSALVSLADKIDNIASFFCVGLIPTGSEDPYGLRRQAMGILNILADRDYPLSLDLLIDAALQGLEKHIFSHESSVKKELSEQIMRFFIQRLEGILLGEGYSYDTVNSVLQATTPIPAHNIRDIKKRINIISSMKKSQDFPDLLMAAKRVCNILANTKSPKLKQDLLIEEPEKELFNAVNNTKDKLIETDYKALFELKDPINTFFDKVLVMDKRTEIKENRLALLQTVRGIFDSLGDFSKIT
jgi:glycyl-tRNA synthetase beta chain